MKLSLNNMIFSQKHYYIQDLIQPTITDYRWPVYRGEASPSQKMNYTDPQRVVPISVRKCGTSDESQTKAESLPFIQSKLDCAY